MVIMDILEISALKIKAKIGVHPWEQRILQDLVLDITLPIDCTRCHDRLENTIYYDFLCREITTFFETNHFALIETAAEAVAAFIKKLLPNIPSLTLRISKPHAIANAGNISVRICR